MPIASAVAGTISSAAQAQPPAVVFEHVSLAFDDQPVLRDLSLRIDAGSMTMLLGASGSGKSLILKLILGLLRPDSGAISVYGQRIDLLSEHALLRARADIGIMFQENALFDSLTVADNVGYRLSEETDTPPAEVDRRVSEVLLMVGLAEYGARMPSELSGGQRRRVAIARAIAARPRLLLLDDPTSGLDPVTATSIDDEIVAIRDLEHATSIVVTHQIRDAFRVATHVATRTPDGRRIDPADGEVIAGVRFLVLHQGRIWFDGNAAELRASEDPYLKEFLFMTLPPW